MKKRAVGRPLSFDVDQALDAAMHVFWRRGYEGASLEDLTAAMGIKRPSLYATFGDKKALFAKALDRYANGPAAYVGQALAEPVARTAMEKLLRGAVELMTRPGNPPGCLMMRAAPESRPVKHDIALRRRLERARNEEDWPLGASPAGLARYFTIVLRGLAVEAAGGASRRNLLQAVETAMRVWPVATR